MKRRDFLKTAVISGASTIILPYISFADKKVIPVEDVSYSEVPDLGSQSLDFTDNFFKYMKKNPNIVEFPYTRVTTPSFVADCKTLKVVGSGKAGDIPLLVKTRKLKAQGIWDKSYDIRHGIDYGNRNKEKIMELTFELIVKEMNIEYHSFSGNKSEYVYYPENRPIKMFYIYQLLTTPVLYTTDFCPRRGFMIRYVRLYKDMITA